MLEKYSADTDAVSGEPFVRPAWVRTASLVQGSFAATTATLNLAAVAWGLVNFGLLLWLPSDLQAKGFTVAGSNALLAQSALLALPTTFLTAWMYQRWSTKWTLVLLLAVLATALLGLTAIGTGYSAKPRELVVLFGALLVGCNGIIAVLLPYSAENYPLLARGRATGFVASSSKFGGMVAQMVSMAAAIPSLTTAAIVLAVPVCTSAVMVGWFGAETRGRTLE
jgi:putative MFS transporter